MGNKKENKSKNKDVSKEKSSPKKAQKDFFIAGIGASAGGITAMKSFVSNIKQNSGVAYIFVPHLDPERESNMSEIIQKNSSIGVKMISEGMKVEPNKIYIIPPGFNLALMKSEYYFPGWETTVLWAFGQLRANLE